MRGGVLMYFELAVKYVIYSFLNGPTVLKRQRWGELVTQPKRPQFTSATIKSLIR